ncbi:hypothetical protein CPY53_04305 [Paenibacillus polymyxa]|uniref:hypothetical protein n=1 Tax=Paenibacillus polymyxa TaxID=1406 RepID=UPI001F57F40C|nr:hypothetical protein [Paenibacillus polymyxa]UNL92827.1 hypothetical protein CPY53_04305 [Paenibacillus polymyxa]
MNKKEHVLSLLDSLIVQRVDVTDTNGYWHNPDFRLAYDSAVEEFGSYELALIEYGAIPQSTKGKPHGLISWVQTESLPNTVKFEDESKGSHGYLPKKDRLFERIDELIDRGVDVTNISQELSIREYDSIRKQAVRAFGSYAQALREYGLYDCNGTPNELELQRCFEITEDFRVVETADVAYVCDIYNLDYFTFRKVSQEIRERVEIDALDDFYREHYPFDNLPTRVLRKAYPKLYGYLRKHYGTYRKFLAAYKVSYNYALSERYKGRDSIPLGHEFERKLGEILRAIYPDVRYHVKVGACIPDFIVSGTEWVDAKLSANSILDPRCKTLEKYAKETNSLTVYYARGEPVAESVGIATVVHVTALYQALRSGGRTDLIADMEAFIASVSYRKEDAA